jgi:hypothetical protein
MSASKSIKLKAAFLLTVFALNTLVAFACSIGIEMGFNHYHYAGEKNRKIHLHGHKHAHGAHSHTSGDNHFRDLTADDHHKNSAQKDGCCNEKTVQFHKLDKCKDHAPNPVIKMPVLVAFLAAFSGLEIGADHTPLLHKAFIPQYYPPPDKRIIIQSFQI